MTRALDRSSDGASLRRVTDALTLVCGAGRSSGGWVKFHCPTHEDKTPSLGVRYNTVKGKTTVECFGPCEDTTVLAAASLTIRDLFDDPTHGTGRTARRAPGGSSNGLVDLADRRPPAAPKPMPNGDKSRVQLGPVVGTYVYTDQAGEPVGRVLRYEPKTFRPQVWKPATRRFNFGGFGPVLYRLPQIATAIGAGETVYLVEGEKDADTAADHYQVTGTTNASGGALGHFLPAHADQLRGAHVVIVADRDATGYGHAAEAAERLTGIAASVRTVQARAGKDLTDHAAAGHSLAELDPVDPRAELHVINGGKNDGGGGQPPTNSGGTDDGEEPNTTARYRYRHGETVRVAKGHPVMWHCEVSVVNEQVDDDGDPDSEAIRAGSQLQLRRRAVDETGEQIRDVAGEYVYEQVTAFLPAMAERDGSWPDHLPWPNLLPYFTPRFKADALAAAKHVKAGPRSLGRRYLAPGWREENGKHRFIHAGGAITGDGLLALDNVDLPVELQVINLPAPTADHDRLAAALAAGLDPLVDLPARIVAPLIGLTFRGLFSPPDTTIHLAGPPESGKTAIARCAAMHWVAPGMHRRSKHKQMRSGRADEAAGSTKALFDALHLANCVPFLADDYRGRKQMDALATVQNVIYNHTGRKVLTREGKGKFRGLPRATFISTGEDATTGSSASRTLTIPVTHGDLAPTKMALKPLFEALESKQSRAARALIGSSFLQWVAHRRTELTTWLEELETESYLTTAWDRQILALNLDGEAGGRMVELAMQCTAGWAALLTYLRETGALTPARADQLWSWAMTGLADQIVNQDQGQTDGPGQLLDLLRDALSAGVCHLSNKGGREPVSENPDAPVAYGWTPRLGVGGPIAAPGTNKLDVLWYPRGDRVGFLTDTHVYLNPASTLAAANTAATRAGEEFSESALTLGAAMAGRGWLPATCSRGGKRTTTERLAGRMGRFWILPRPILDDYGQTDPDDQPPTPQGPLPRPPWSDTPATPAQSPRPDVVIVPPADETPTSGPKTRPGDDMVAAFELRAPERPCTVCGEPTTVTPVPVRVTPTRQHDKTPKHHMARPVPVTAGRWLAAAAVVTADELVLPDGTHVHLGTEITHLGHLAELAAHLRLGHGGSKYVLPSPAQLLLTTEGMARFGITIDNAEHLDADDASTTAAQAGKNAAAAAVAAGWKLSQDDELRVWTRIWRPRVDDQPSISVQVVLVPLMGAFDDARTLIKDNPAPAVLARRAQMVADTLGVTWGASGGVTGLTLLRQLRPPRATNGRAPFAATEYIAPPQAMRDAGRVPNSAFLWCRPADTDETHRPFLHAYDANAMYLAAQGATEVGIGAPVHHKDGSPFNPKAAGLWRIQPGPADDWRLPDATRPGMPLAGTTGWYTTPVIRYLTEIGQDPEILESYTWPTTTRRYFDQWYQVVRDARAAMMAAADPVIGDGDPDAATVLQAVKEVYKRTVGRLARTEDGHAKSPLYRPDWRLAIVSTANVNLLRKLRTAGQTADLWPVAISTDEVFYLSDNPDPITALPAPLKLDDGLGQFKVTRTTTVTGEIRDQLAARKLAGLLPLVPKLTPEQRDEIRQRLAARKLTGILPPMTVVDQR